eukprot:11565527-Alexandrium_andersonii.AAC.1
MPSPCPGVTYDQLHEALDSKRAELFRYNKYAAGNKATDLRGWLLGPAPSAMDGHETRLTRDRHGVAAYLVEYK